MKTLMLLAVVCFSFFAYADNFSYLTDGQKKESMMNYTNSQVSKCLNDYAAEAARYNHTMSDQETKLVTQVCGCVVDKTIDTLVGKEFISNNDINAVIVKSNAYLDSKNQIMPLIKECLPKKANYIK